MITAFRETLKKDSGLKFIFWGGLLVQIIFAITSVGYHFPDQHFQIIEFSSAQSGEPTGAPFVWEWENHVRPTFQIYLFTGFHKVLALVGINNPFTEMTILRVLISIVMFFFFNLFTFTFLRNENKRVITFAFLILNFSWFLPYLRTQYSAEMVSSFFFFGTVLLYYWKKDVKPGFAFLILIGILFGFTFYIRMQTILLLAGFAIWLIWVQKAKNHILPLLIGFIIGCAANLILDILFYKEFVFTPFAYFYVNIVEGRASGMGTEGFWYYIGIIVGYTAAPFLNLILLYYAIKAYRKKYYHLVFLTTALFFIGHCFIGHKEDRFIFPIFNVLPVILGFGIVGFQDYYKNCKAWIMIMLKCIIVISVFLNFFLLAIFSFTPWCQSVRFIQQLYNKFEKTNTKAKIYYVKRSPFGTPSQSPLIYYSRAFDNIEIIRLSTLDSLQYINEPNAYVALTFNDIKNDRSRIDSMNFSPVLYSSQLLWNFNDFMHSKKKQTINEIWVLYQKEQHTVMSKQSYYQENNFNNMSRKNNPPSAKQN